MLNRNQNHFGFHNIPQQFEQERYPVDEQYSDEKKYADIIPGLEQGTNNSATSPVLVSVASPTRTRNESRRRRRKWRSPSKTLSDPRLNSRSRSRLRSSSGSRSSISSSKLRSAYSDHSGLSRSPSRSRSPTNQNHFRFHDIRQQFQQQRYPIGEQYSEEKIYAITTPRLRQWNNNRATSSVAVSVASPTRTKSENRRRRKKRRSHSRTPSRSHLNSRSRSWFTRSPSKSRSPTNQNFCQQLQQRRYPVGEQYSYEKKYAGSRSRFKHRYNNITISPVSSPTRTRCENWQRRKDWQSPSKIPSDSHLDSRSQSHLRLQSSSSSRSSIYSSKLQSASIYHNEQSRSRSKSRSPTNRNHFWSHNFQQQFEQQRFPVGEPYSDENYSDTTPSLSQRTNNNAVAPVAACIASPFTTTCESMQRWTKQQSPSRTSSGSHLNSRSHSPSRLQSSSDSQSSISSLKSQSAFIDHSGRSPSPSNSRFPTASYGNQSNVKDQWLHDLLSAITNPSSTVPSSANTSAINCTSNNTQESTPAANCFLASSQKNCDKKDKRLLGICIRNLPVRSTDESLKAALFHEYKNCGTVKMVKVTGEGTSRYVVVSFKKSEDVDKALEVSKDKYFFGYKLEVTAHAGSIIEDKKVKDVEGKKVKPLKPELNEYHPKASRTLIIGNLRRNISIAELLEHFGQFGEIIDKDIKRPPVGLAGITYAYIQYSDIASVVKAIRKLNGEYLDDLCVRLCFGKTLSTNCVWLDGVIDSVSERFLTHHFSRFGQVTYIAIDRKKHHALVFYKSKGIAQNAVFEVRRKFFDGMKFQADFADEKFQAAFFDKMKLTGQQLPDGKPNTSDSKTKEETSSKFEAVCPDDLYRETRLGSKNRYEGHPESRGNKEKPKSWCSSEKPR